MQVSIKPVRARSRRLTAALLAALGVAAGACSSGGDSITTPEGPTLPGNPITVPVLRQSAFVFDVNVRDGKVTVTEPASPTLRGGNGLATEPAYSILSSDVVSITTSNFFASPVGAITPNRIRVQFDVLINNKLGNIELLTPTFPAAPAGQNGVLLFPFATNVLQTSGGVGAGGNEVVVELPSNGNVNPSPDWNGNGAPDRPDFPALPGAGGNPFNFFNDASCAAAPPAGGTSDCFRYETFGPIPAGASSSVRRVGFDIDGSVGQFRARLVVAADVRSGVAPTGTVAGTITSPARGPLAGVSVQISGLANPVVTDAAGAYSATVGIGPRSVTILTATLPSGCSTITPANGQSVTVNGGATATQNYSVTCTVPTGTLTVTATRAGTGTQSLSGLVARINPDAVGLADITASLTGTAASVSSGPVSVNTGTGVVTLENIPADCSVTSPAAGSAPYSLATVGATQTVAFTVTCLPPPPPPARIRFIQQFGAVSGGTVDLTTTYDASLCDITVNPTCPSAANLAVGGVSQTVTLTGTAAGRVSARAAQSTANFGTATLGGTLPIVTYSAVTTDPAGFVTAPVAIVRFTIGAGAAGSLTTVTTVPGAATPAGDDITFIVSGAGDNVDFVESTVAVP